MGSRENREAAISGVVTQWAGGIQMVTDKMFEAALRTYRASVHASKPSEWRLNKALEAYEQAREVPAMPTREEIAQGLWHRLAPDSQLDWFHDCQDKERYLVMADCFLSLLAQRQQPPQAVEPKPGSPAHVALWDAITEFAREWKHDGNTSVARQKAVVGVERALREYVGSVCPSVPQAVVTDVRVQELIGEGWPVARAAQERISELERELNRVRELGMDGLDREEQAAVDVEMARSGRTAAERERDTALRDLAAAREQLAAMEAKLQALKHIIAIKDADRDTTPIAPTTDWNARKYGERVERQCRDFLAAAAPTVATPQEQAMVDAMDNNGWRDRGDLLRKVRGNHAAPAPASGYDTIAHEATASAAETLQRELTDTKARLQSLAERCAQMAEHAASGRTATTLEQARAYASSVCDQLQRALTETAEPAPQPVEPAKPAFPPGFLGALSREDDEEPAKPQVTLEALQIKTGRFADALYMLLCDVGIVDKAQGPYADALVDAMKALDTDHAEAGKGDM